MRAYTLVHNPEPQKKRRKVLRMKECKECKQRSKQRTKSGEFLESIGVVFYWAVSYIVMTFLIGVGMYAGMVSLPLWTLYAGNDNLISGLLIVGAVMAMGIVYTILILYEDAKRVQKRYEQKRWKAEE